MFNLAKDQIGRGSPLERSGRLIVVLDEVEDCLSQLAYAPEALPTDSSQSDLGEEPLDLVEPTTVCWNEVETPARVLGHPTAHRGGLMRGVVVQDHVDFQPGRHFLLQLP